MNSRTALAAVLLSVPTFSVAVAQTSGVSNPPAAAVEETPLPPPQARPVQAKPSAAVPMDDAMPTAVQPPQAASAPALSVTVTPTLRTRTAAVDPDAGIITELPGAANELPANTLLRVRLNAAISTTATHVGDAFSGVVIEDVSRAGSVVLPAGATVEGRVAHLSGGRRIHGTAMIRLMVVSLRLADGTRLPLHASVLDTDQTKETRVDSEGNILRKDHVKSTLAAMSLTTGGAAAAGAVLGGGPGAIIGAGVGAGLSTAWWLRQDRQAHLPEASVITFSLVEPVSLEGHLPGQTPATPVPVAALAVATAPVN